MTLPDLEDLKLVAFDQDDLAVMSAHLQDSVIKVRDLAFLPGENRFALVARRFDWSSVGTEPRRRLTGLHFERVLNCRQRGIDQSRPDQPLNLLAVTFDGPDAPAGTARLVFAGGACIELDLECIEACLKDLGPAWAAASRPAHDVETT